MNRCVPGAPPQWHNRKGKPMNHKKWLSAVFAFTWIAFLSGCGGVFEYKWTLAETAAGAENTRNGVLGGPGPEISARLRGGGRWVTPTLFPAGMYTSVTAPRANPQIGSLNVNPPARPTISTL